MDSAHFQKLCRDCGLVDKATGITEIDLVFCYVSAAAGVWTRPESACVLLLVFGQDM